MAALPELGPPLAAFVRGQTPPDQIVTLAYGPTATIPAGSLAPVDAGAPVVILVMELPGTTDGAYLKKLLQAGTTIDSVRVGGHAGFWIAGRRTSCSTSPPTVMSSTSPRAWPATCWPGTTAS